LGLGSCSRWWIGSSPKRPFLLSIGTTLFAYGALVLFLAWDGSAKDILALGLIGAIPAVVCSWLSSGKPNGRVQ